MRTRQGWVGLRVLIATAALGVWVLPVATANPVDTHITYRTTGSVGLQAGNAGSPVIFHGVDNGVFQPSTPFNFGEFEVVPSVHGSVDMPFVITYMAKAIDGTPPMINETPIILQGRIVGMLGDDGPSYLEAIFDQGAQPADPKYYSPHPAPPFRTGDLVNTISINGGKEFLTLSITDTGRTAVEGRIDVATVPEPSTLALLTLAAIGVGLRHWRRTPI